MINLLADILGGGGNRQPDNRLTHVGMRMLENGGPSLTPRGMFDGVGDAYAYGQQANDDREDRRLTMEAQQREADEAMAQRQRQQQADTATAAFLRRSGVDDRMVNLMVSQAQAGNTGPLNEMLQQIVRGPDPRRIMEDASGRQRYVDTGDFVFSDMADFQPEEERPNPPSGYRWTEEGNQEPIPGGPATRLPAEVAGRVAAAETVLDQLDSAERVLLDPEFGMRDRAISAAGAVLPGLETEFNQAQRTVTLGIEAALRMMTGAAAPQSEVDNYERQFMPQITDPLRVRQQKLQNLRTFMENAREIMTRGRGAPHSPAQTQSGVAPTQRLRFNPHTGDFE